MEMLSQSICITENELISDVDLTLLDITQIEKLIECINSTRGVSADEFKKIANPKFSTRHIDELMSALNMDLDITYMVDKEYSLEQMKEIKIGMYYADGNFDEFCELLDVGLTPKHMNFLNKATWSSINPKLLAHKRLGDMHLDWIMSLINDIRIKYSIKTVEEIFK